MELLHRLLPQLAAGCLAGAVATAGLIASNVGSLRDLMLHAEGGWIAALLLTSGFVVTFGGAALAGAIGSLGTEPD
jgi:hypothetical protein